MPELETNPFEAHELIVTYGDCEFWGRCSCGQSRTWGPVRPDQSLDEFAMPWERHAMAAINDARASVDVARKGGK